MISVTEATEIVLSHLYQPRPEPEPLGDTVGRVLLDPIKADRDFPPFHRVMMDGIAIAHQRFVTGQRTFPVSGVAAAGSPQLALSSQDKCFEVMTGAVLPEGTDTVIRYEDLEITDGNATIKLEELEKGLAVHSKGSDRKVGQEIVPVGTRISPAEIGVAATVGKVSLNVASLPKMAVITTGDELVDVSAIPQAHQIRRSNGYKIFASLRSYGIKAELLHLEDDLEQVITGLGRILEVFDVAILSGGVSKGKFDYVPQALEKVGVKKLFHRVSQRPGKPFWFGLRDDDRFVFALPGNPVSSFMCTHRYLLPWLKASTGMQAFSEQTATLAADIHFKPDLSYFAQVRLKSDEEGRWMAYPVEGHGSGDLANLVDADAFIELSRGENVYKKGDSYRIFTFRN